MRVTIRFERLGGHVHTGWWVGPNKLAPNSKSGVLVFREEEWTVFRAFLESRFLQDIDLEIIEVKRDPDDHPTGSQDPDWP